VEAIFKKKLLLIAVILGGFIVDERKSALAFFYNAFCLLSLKTAISGALQFSMPFVFRGTVKCM